MPNPISIIKTKTKSKDKIKVAKTNTTKGVENRVEIRKELLNDIDQLKQTAENVTSMYKQIIKLLGQNYEERSNTIDNMLASNQNNNILLDRKTNLKSFHDQLTNQMKSINEKYTRLKKYSSSDKTESRKLVKDKIKLCVETYYKSLDEIYKTLVVRKDVKDKNIVVVSDYNKLKDVIDKVSLNISNNNGLKDKLSCLNEKTEMINNQINDLNAIDKDILIQTNKLNKQVESQRLALISNANIKKQNLLAKVCNPKEKTPNNIVVTSSTNQETKKAKKLKEILDKNRISRINYNGNGEKIGQLNSKLQTLNQEKQTIEQKITNSEILLSNLNELYSIIRLKDTNSDNLDLDKYMLKWKKKSLLEKSFQKYTKYYNYGTDQIKKQKSLTRIKSK